MQSVASHPGDGAARQAVLADRYATFAKAANGTAFARRTHDDHYGETLAASRAEVYAEAAELVRLMPPPLAAREMINRATAAHVRNPPLVGFDSAGVQYTIARAWQFCAWQIDPSLPEVAPAWN